MPADVERILSATRMAMEEEGVSVEVAPARTSRDQRQFLELPYSLYRGNPHWVPPLRLAQKDILNTKRHPFYKTADVEMFLARRSGRVVGRVMAILNHAHNEFHSERAGFFGFFEAENDQEAASALFEASADWLRSRGAEVMRGPMNPSTNYEVGLLVDAFDQSPAVMMTYNPAYYVELIERSGFEKLIDMYAYLVGAHTYESAGKLKRVSERLKAKAGIRVRTVDLKNFKQEAALIRRIYNDAWSTNWGFVPVSEEEFEHLAKDMKQIVDPRVVLIAEQQVDGAGPRPIAFMLAIPDVNRALKKINGRLFPFGLLKLLWHSRKIDSIRIVIMGVVKEHHNLGIASVLYDEIHERAPRSGYPTGEMSWVLETNTMMNRAAELLGGRRIKTYRVYEKKTEGKSRK
jgi:GNAT superfamily N-acetyltransferase